MNVAELKSKLAELFICVDGPPRAYFELPMGTDLESPVFRIQYVTVCIVRLGDFDESESLLCDQVHKELVALLESHKREPGNLVLFWRVQPSIERAPYSTGEIYHRLRMRLAIPGLDLCSIFKSEGEEVQIL